MSIPVRCDWGGRCIGRRRGGDGDRPLCASECIREPDPQWRGSSRRFFAQPPASLEINHRILGNAPVLPDLATGQRASSQSTPDADRRHAERRCRFTTREAARLIDQSILDEGLGHHVQGFGQAVNGGAARNPAAALQARNVVPMQTTRLLDVALREARGFPQCAHSRASVLRIEAPARPLVSARSFSTVASRSAGAKSQRPLSLIEGRMPRTRQTVITTMETLA